MKLHSWDSQVSRLEQTAERRRSAADVERLRRAILSASESSRGETEFRMFEALLDRLNALLATGGAAE